MDDIFNDNVSLKTETPAFAKHVLAPVPSLSGCELMKCKYYVNGKCTDPNDWVNESGDAVCGLRNDAILVENEHSI